MSTLMNTDEAPGGYERETVLSARDAARFLELLDRSTGWNARLARSLAAYQSVTGGYAERSFEWPRRTRTGSSSER